MPVSGTRAEPTRCAMTTANTQTGAVPNNAQPSPRYRLPNPPERDPEDTASAKHLALTGNAHHLIHHFGNPDTTLVAAERYIVLAPIPDGTRFGAVPTCSSLSTLTPKFTRKATGISSPSRASRRTSCWKWHRQGPATLTLEKSATTPRRWASRNTGVLTKRQRANTTERGWPGKGWRTANTFPFPSTSWITTYCRDTARS